MKSFKSIREGYSVEPGVSQIDDAPEDPMSFVEIKPKKTKAVKEGIVDTAAKAKARIFSSVNNKKNELYKNAVKEDLQEAVSIKKEKHSWGTMMTVHHGSDTSYPLHPEHQSAIKKLRPGMKTTFKDETNSTVHAHREGDTVHLHRPKTSNKLTSLPYHHFDESVNEAYTEDDIAKGGTVIYKLDGKHYMSKVSHKSGGGAGTQIHTTSNLGHKIKLNQVVSTDASDWNRFKNIKEETVVETKGAPKGFHFTKDGKLKRGDADQDGNGGPMLRTDPLDKLRNKVPAVSEKVEQVDEAQMSNLEIQHAVNLHSMLKNNNPNMAHSNATKNAHISMVKKHGSSWRKKAGILEETEQMNEKLTSKDIKMAVGVAKDKRYAGGNMTGAVKTMEKMKPGLSKHPRVQQVLKSTNEEEEQIVELNKSTLASYAKKAKGEMGLSAMAAGAQGARGDAVGKAIDMAHAKKRSKGLDKAITRLATEGIDFFKIWESIKPEEVVIDEEAFDPVAHKKEHDRLMGKHIEAHKAVSKAFADMKAQGKSPSFDIPENDKLNDIKKEIAAHNAKIPRGPAPKPGSAAHYYASKKPGEYTGD
jgi:hypothetical protein